MENKTNIVKTVQYIHGDQFLRPQDISIFEANETDNGLMEFGLRTDFDVDAVFGTHTNTTENDDTLSAYAYFDANENRVTDSLTIIVWTNGGPQQYSYEMSTEEKKAMLQEMRRFCSCERNCKESKAKQFLAVINNLPQNEFQYLVWFAQNANYASETDVNQLRSLWTAYCIHQDIEIDTEAYDFDILTLWKAIEEEEKDQIEWDDFEIFDRYMAEYLV